MTPWDEAIQKLRVHVTTLAADMVPFSYGPGLSTEQTRKDLDRAILRAAHAVAAGKEPQP